MQKIGTVVLFLSLSGRNKTKNGKKCMIKEFGQIQVQQISMMDLFGHTLDRVLCYIRPYVLYKVYSFIPIL